MRSCGFCSYQCPIASDVCCSGVCADLLTSSTNCGQCGFFCVSLPNIQACTPLMDPNLFCRPPNMLPADVRQPVVKGACRYAACNQGMGRTARKRTACCGAPHPSRRQWVSCRARDACARAQVAQCTNGNCIATCLSPLLTQCLTGSGPFCANLQTDPNYCGSCATSCPSDQNNRGTRVCTAGVRAPRCAGVYDSWIRMRNVPLAASFACT